MRLGRLLLIVVLQACGDDGGTAMPDAPPGPPTVMVKSPNGGENYYPTAMVSVTWEASGGTGALTGLVEVENGTSTTMIATGVDAPVGTMVTTPWPLGGIADASTYRIRVTVTDGAGMTGTDTSDGVFQVRTAAAVSFATNVQPIFTANCTGSSCHDNAQPAANLQLTNGAAYNEMVSVNAMQCAANKLVDPGKPEASYLQFKLDGSGPCFAGNSMPLGGNLTPMQINTVRDWIQNGALDN